MLTLLNRTDIPVAGGAVKPLMRNLIIADNVHGESGLDGPALPEPAFAPQNCTAVELMAKVLRESAEPVTLVATGPQTTLVLKQPGPEASGSQQRMIPFVNAFVDAVDVPAKRIVVNWQPDFWD